MSFGGPEPSIIMHYDGETWSVLERPSNGWSIGIWGTSASNVFIVGDDGSILHYSGN